MERTNFITGGAVFGGAGHDVLYISEPNDSRYFAHFTLNAANSIEEVRGTLYTDPKVNGASIDLETAAFYGEVHLYGSSNTFAAAAGNAVVEAGGSDTVRAGSGSDIIYGGALVYGGGGGNDIYGAAEVYAGSGNDFVTGGLDGILDGGAGNDTFTINGKLSHDGTALHFTGLDPSLGFEVFRLSRAILTDHDDFVDLRPFASNALAASVLGGAGNDTILCGAQDQTLDGGSGADSMAGGAGNDAYIVDDAGDRLVEAAGRGIDTIVTSIDFSLRTQAVNVENIAAASTAGGLLLEGNAAANTVTGGAGNDTLIGDAGNDQISGLGSRNQLYGGDGNDTLSSGDGQNTLDGGLGSDTYWGGRGDDTFVVGVGDVLNDQTSIGHDTVMTALPAYPIGAYIENLVSLSTTGASLTGNLLANRITGNLGDDTLNGLGGQDTLVGGAGDDLYIVDNAGVVVSETIGKGTDTVWTALAEYHLSYNVENLVSKGWATLLYGNVPANRITGDNGSDELYGGRGNDTLVGGEGNDSLDGGSGADSMAGQSGDDFYKVDNAVDKISDLGGGFDTVLSYLTTCKLGAYLEAVYGQAAGNSTLTGNELANVVVGNAGNDLLSGWTGDDTLDGRNGNDVLLGGAGNDILIGGMRHDSLTCSWGHDAFVIDSADLAASADVILDFTQGVDTISLDMTGTGLFDGLAAGAVPDSVFKLKGQALEADDRLIYDGSTGQIAYDADGSGSAAAVVFATLANHPGLSAADFWVF